MIGPKETYSGVANYCNFLRQSPYSCVMTRRLAEVAKKVGVSEATVSRVLNGKPGVSQTTRDAVLTALGRCSATSGPPNCAGGGAPRLVGLVLPELQKPDLPGAGRGGRRRAGPAGLHAGAVRAAGAGGLSEASYVRMLLDQHVSGMVFAGGNFAEADSPHDHYELLLERGVPAVAGQRGRRAPRLPAGLRRRCRRGGAGPGAPAVAGPPPGRADHRPGRPHAVAAQAGPRSPPWPRGPALPPRTPWSTRCSRWRPGTRPPPAWCGRASPASSAANDPLALGAIRAVRRLGMSVPGGRLRGGLRRLRADDLHGSAADHGPAAHRRDGPGRGEHPWSSRLRAARFASAELLFEPELVVRGSTARAPGLTARRSPRRPGEGRVPRTDMRPEV